MTIDDPLSRFYEEEQSREAGVKNPVTGLREEYDTAARQKKRHDEISRKSQVSKHIITQLMQQDLGREWLYDLLTSCNAFGTPYAVDPQLTAYNAGAMYVGKLIESDIKKFTPKEFFNMLEEAWTRDAIWNDEVVDSTK